MTIEIMTQNWIRKLWSEEMLQKLVQKGILTPQQYQQIVATPRIGE